MRRPIVSEIFLDSMQTGFAPSNRASIRASGHFHLKNAQIDSNLQKLPIGRAVDQPDQEAAWLMRPGLQDVSEILVSHSFLLSEPFGGQLKDGKQPHHPNFNGISHPRPVMRPVLAGWLPVGWFNMKYLGMACLEVKIPRFYTDLNARTVVMFDMIPADGLFSGS